MPSQQRDVKSLEIVQRLHATSCRRAWAGLGVNMHVHQLRCCASCISREIFVKAPFSDVAPGFGVLGKCHFARFLTGLPKSQQGAAVGPVVTGDSRPPNGRSGETTIHVHPLSAPLCGMQAAQRRTVSPLHNTAAMEVYACSVADAATHQYGFEVAYCCISGP